MTEHVIADRRLYLDASKTKIVDPEDGVFLLTVKGRRVPAEFVDQYEPQPDPAAEAEKQAEAEKAAAEKAEAEKQAETPTNKQAKAPATKQAATKTDG